MSELTWPMPARRAPFSSAATMTTRALRLTLRNPESLITALALPVILMLMFVYLFGGAIVTGTKYVDFVVPGVLLVCAGFGTATVAVTVAQDLTGGVMDRFRSMDVPGAALLSGHVIASLARNLLSTALVFAVALAIGFRSHATPGHWLAALAVLALFVFALSWVAATIGVAAGSVDAANGMGFLISFIAYPSSAFVPISTMPAWLQAFARNQPVTAVADTVRGLLNGGNIGASAWHAVVWSIAIITATVLITGALFTRRGQT
jgi:ABC-2 type transport system permease protein